MYTQAELDSFNIRKLDIYKGTFAVCVIYGLIALIILYIVIFAEYKMYLPAIITFIVGALFIILYLVIEIYMMKPRKNKIKLDMNDDLICPDYWKLKLTNANIKKNMIDNNKQAELFKDIKFPNDIALNYTCEYDPDMFGDKKIYAETKNFMKDKDFYKQGVAGVQSDNLEYLYVNDTSNDEILGKYAQFTGIYSSGKKTSTGEYVNTSFYNASGPSTFNLYTNSVVPIDKSQATKELYYSKPLVCNIVYPQLLAKLDKGTPEQNKYRCAYAKACDIAWTDIGCTYKPEKYIAPTVTPSVSPSAPTVKDWEWNETKECRSTIMWVGHYTCFSNIKIPQDIPTKNIKLTMKAEVVPLDNTYYADGFIEFTLYNKPQNERLFSSTYNPTNSVSFDFSIYNNKVMNTLPNTLVAGGNYYFCVILNPQRGSISNWSFRVTITMSIISNT